MFKPFGTVILLVVSLFCQSLGANNDFGPRLVERELPILYRAALRVISYDRTWLLFRHWSSHEVEDFRAAVRKLVTNTLPSHGPVPGPMMLYERSGQNLFAVLGEVYGSSILRQRVRSESGIRFISENEYRERNESRIRRRRPDGLLVRMEKGNIYILSVLESKLGDASNLSLKQVAGYLETWKSVGIVVPDRDSLDGKARFAPNRVFIGDVAEGRSVHDSSETDIIQRMTLVTNRNRPWFTGVRFVPPFSAIEGRNIVYDVFEQMLRGREWQARIEGPIRDLGTFIHRDEIINSVADWLLEMKSWPKESGKRVEKSLAHQIRMFGGQSRFFIEFDSDVQEAVMQLGLLPAMGSLHRALGRAQSRTPGLLRAVRYFSNAYCHGQSLDEVLRMLSKDSLLYRFIRPSDIPGVCTIQLDNRGSG